MKNIVKKLSINNELNDDFIKSVYSVQVKETLNLQSKIDKLIDNELKISITDED